MSYRQDLFLDTTRNLRSGKTQDELSEALNECVVRAREVGKAAELTLKITVKPVGDSGQVQFQYKENINGQAGLTGQLEIPQKIKLAIRPFLNGAPYELEARFRYRVRQGGLMMWYTLIRPHLVKDDAVSGLLKTVREKLEVAKVIEAEYRT